MGQTKLKQLYQKVVSLRDAEQQHTLEYHQAYADLQQTYDQVRRVEQLTKQPQNLLIQQAPLTLPDTSARQQPEVMWTECQLEQLRNQIKAYKHLIKGEVNFEEPCFKQILLPAEDWALQQQMQHQRTMKIYRENFESNQILYFHDLWEYVERKIESGQTTFIHPQNFNQHPSTSQNDPTHAYQSLKIANEIDALNDLSSSLEKLIEDPYTPNDVKQQAQLYQKLIELMPLQQSIKDQVLQRYNKNQSLFEKMIAKTKGDYLYENQLVDRDFYKRARVFTTSKKEARTIDRFEQQMRNGQEIRRGARRKEFLKEVLDHQKDFVEFHKKRQAKIKKNAYLTKSHLELKERKVMNIRDKQERERIKALKDNDMDAYINLINTQKNSRLMQILEQTHKYLQQLGTKVVIQKKENETNKNKTKSIIGESSDEAQEFDVDELDAYGNKIEVQKSEDEEVDDAELIKQNLRNSSKIYYKITHSIVEEIPEQPMLLKGGQLKSYQLFGLSWMISLYNNNLNGILADEMGLGKTIQTISLFAYLIEKKNNEGPFLIVVPLTTINNWMNEFHKWAPSIHVITYKGKKSERPMLAQHLKQDKYHVVLTTYEYILNDKSTLCKIQWQYIVVDEGHRMKNTKSKFAMTLGQSYQSAHRILLTGTPLQNNLAELWSLLNFLLPKIFNSCEEFKKWFDKPLSKVHPATAKQVKQNDNQILELSEEEQLLVINRLHQVLRPFLLRRVKVEVEKELPPKSELVIKVELSAWQKSVYNGITEFGRLARDPQTGKLGNQSLRNAMMQLRKIVNHPYLFLDYYPENNPDWIWMTSGKFELLDRILPKFVESGHKVLIFSQFTQLLTVMSLFFDYRGIKHLKLDGAMKQEERHANMMTFNNVESEFRVFLLSTRAGGQGLNLQVADTVIIFDSDFNPQMDEQAKDRAHRIGQKHEVRVYRLITRSNVEEGILDRATSKKDLDNKIIQAGMFNQKASDQERHKQLQELIKKDYVQESEDEEEGTHEDEFYTDEQLNEIMARDEAELELFAKLDNERYSREKIQDRIKLVEEKTKKTVKQNQNVRLMQDFEVPQWIADSVQELPQNMLEEYGLGKRKREQVNYKEVLSEAQWLKMIEAGLDPQQEIENRKKEDCSELLNSEDEEQEEEISGDDFVIGSKKKRKI